jgi:hypothetical protein
MSFKRRKFRPSANGSRAFAIREAFLTQSSGVKGLDSEALFAATSSDYRPAASGAVALYEAVYEFVP